MNYRITSFFLLLAFFAGFSGCAKRKQKRISPPVRVYSFEEIQEDVSLKVTSEICDKFIYHKNPLLKKYQPVEIIITNNSQEKLELHPYNIGLHFHSLKKILKKTPGLGSGRKTLLALDTVGGGLYGYTTLVMGISTPILYFTGIGLLAITSLLVFDSLYHSARIKAKKARISRHLGRTILDPAEVIVIEPQTTLRRNIFCPRKYIKQHFNLTLLKSESFEPLTFNVSLKEMI